LDRRGFGLFVVVRPVRKKRRRKKTSRENDEVHTYFVKENLAVSGIGLK
jgi:4-aminobutyrate aminotransferase-like enzyme